MSAENLSPEDQADAEFAAGFDGDPTATPTATPAAQQGDNDQSDKDEPAPADPPAPEYAQFTKDERDELMALREQQQKQFGTAFGKIGGIERTLQQLTSGARVEVAQSDIDTLRNDGFEPLAVALEKVRDLRALPGAGVDQDQIDALVNQRVAAVEQKLELRLLAQAHPDWKQIDADPAFAAWVAAQPDDFKQGLAKASAEFDSAVVGDVMSKFKQSRRPAPATQAADPASARRSRIAANVTPRGAGGPATSNPNDELMAGFNG